MKLRFGPLARGAAAAVAVLAPLTSHMALAMGQSYGQDVALAATAAQAPAAGLLLWTVLPRHRWLAPCVTVLLLAALALGDGHGAPAALLAEAGTAHALLYAGLLALFAPGLRPGHTALVTRLAARLNPGFTPAMIPYTRAVTAAWCLLFAAQLAASALLLAAGSPWWPRLVTTLHLPCVLALAVLESLVRRWRWRHHNPTSLLATIRGTRALMRQATTPSPQRASSSTIR